MDDRALKVLLEDLKDTSVLDDDDSQAQEESTQVLPFPGLTQSQPQQPVSCASPKRPSRASLG